LGGECFCFFLPDIAFSYSQKRQRRQALVGPFQKMPFQGQDFFFFLPDTAFNYSQKRLRRQALVGPFQKMPSQGQDFFFTLFHSLTRRIGTRFPWKYVWRTQAPSRAAFFSWSATLGKIPTLDNLRKRHVIMINKCYMCKKTEEFVNHFLLHCDVAFALWYSLFCRFGLS
jgi:hypothetical protein